MDIRQRIFAVLGTDDYIPMKRGELQNKLRIKAAEQAAFDAEIDALLRSGEIARLKKDRLCIASDADLVGGKILFRQSGTATIIPDADPRSPVAEGYPVRSEDTATALHGDRVLARIIRERQTPRVGEKGPEARPHVRVIRILERGSDTIVGTLEEGRHYAYIIPDDPRIIQDILVPPPANSGLRPLPRKGDKVIVKLLEWTQRHVNPSGEIVEVLGRTHEPDAEFKAILHKYQLNPQFPATVEKEVTSLPETVPAQDIGNRVDLRKQFVFTIDPDDAKDFDDALNVEPLANGGVRVGVHIADVSAYVKGGTALDNEAQARGNSTYLVGTVIPMLPHKLSNGLCSLVEAEDRSTKSVFLDYDESGRLTSTSFANSVIRSVKRLTYHQAFAFMRENSLDKVIATPLPPSHQTGATGIALSEVPRKTLQRLQKDIRTLWSIAERLRKARFKKGSLDLDMPETKIYVDENGYADRIELLQNDESHQLIEEFMLSANEAVAKVLKADKIPAIYRVHEDPDPEKLRELRETLLLHGIQCGNLEKQEAMGALLKTLKEHPQGHSLRIHVLRSLKQARYSGHPDGHYGLAKSDYAHFTSPIRRYADLVVHRVMDYYLHRHKVASAPENPAHRYSQGKLESLADHLCITERNSVDAERESVKTKLLEFFERELHSDSPKRFKAIITDVKNHGFFIELIETGAFGLVHVSTLTDDLYLLNRDGDGMIGRRHRRTFTMGDTIEVEVERVDRFKRQIDFRVSTMAPRGANKSQKNQIKKQATKKTVRGKRKPNNKRVKRS